MTKVNQSRIREALTAGTNVKEKGPPVADGILSVTPDTPEMLEWRSRSALDVADTSSTFLDDEDDGPKPHELYGKFTWKIENFSEISKRELRSNVFDVGNYKWYILVYPQGCDVCNHLSLFLCVADYDKLLPGWSHFAQFTIAVVNKDPKKSKYSDTLHRFCKKEHDWGWKKFMELSKVLDGFTVADTLVIKAQVQVILDKPSKPFRCLDPQYRRELVRVYLTNVEGICRRFCEDKKTRLTWAREEAVSFRHFWGTLSAEQQRKYLTDKGEVILKAVVKQFFNEKEVTSTLVMDALYSGCKQIEEHSRSWIEGKCTDNAPIVLIKAERNTFTLCGDLADIADRVQKDFIPAAKDDSKAIQSNDGLTLRSGQDGDDYRRDSIERDEKRLAELGRKTIEMFVIAHIFCEKLEIAYREAEALKRQDQLIAEEFEMARLEESKAQAKAQADKEKKAKKKEKLKLKKEAEKLKREAEEAERKARDDEARRQEAERRAKEAEKKRLEDAQAQPQTQQQSQLSHGRKGAKGREDRRAQQLSQQAAQQQAKAAKQAALSSAFGHIVQSNSHPPQQGPSRLVACAGVPPTAASLPSLSSLAAAVVANAAAASIVCEADVTSHAERPIVREVSRSGSCSDEEVGTVNQATGAPESSGDGEDDVEVAVASSAAGGPSACTGTESDGASESEGRAALEEEVTILRAHVVQLQRLLAERDAEIFALRAQLAELQPTEIADMVKECSAAAALGSAHGTSTRTGTSAASSSSAGSDSAAASASFGRDYIAADGHALHGPIVAAVVAGPAGRSEQEPPCKAETPPMANGPSKPSTSPSSVSAAAAAAAAAAVRRMQPLAATAPTQAHAHDASSLMHPGMLPGRPSSTGPTLPGTGPSAAAGRGLAQVTTAQPRAGAVHGGGEGSASHLIAQPGGHAQQQVSNGMGASSDGHLAPASIMQRSTSVTLPVGGPGTSAAAGQTPYSQLPPNQLSAPTANGRPRTQALDASAGASSVTQTTTGSKPGPYMPHTAASGAGANGIGGVLHSTVAPPQGVSDGLPSYRNAAAGVLGASGQSGPGSAHGITPSAVAAAAAASSSIVSVSSAPLLPVSPSATSAAASGAAAHKHVDDASAAAAAASRHMNHSVAAATEGPFTPNSRLMMQQAQRGGLSFGTPTAVQSAKRVGASTQLDSPGLEDFAHINMIDDLLTE